MFFVVVFTFNFLRQPLHFIIFVHFWLSLLYKELVRCHIFFFFSFPQSHSLLLIVLLALSPLVSKRGISFERALPLPFAFTYSGAALFHGHSRKLQQRVCDPSSVAPLLPSLTLLPHLYRSCCIFHIGCWVAIHCPIVLVFFFFFFSFRFLRFRCKEKVYAVKSVGCFSKSGFFFFFSLSPCIYRDAWGRAAKWISRAK